MAYAYCFRSGEIEVGTFVPEGAIAIAKGAIKKLREMVGVTSRHAYDGKTFLVPGIPEAANERDAGDALCDFCDWLAEGNRGVQIMNAGHSKEGRSTALERMNRAAEASHTCQIAAVGGKGCEQPDCTCQEGDAS